MTNQDAARYLLAVDVGGTFTDATLVDLATGVLRHGKVATTIDDQSKGVLATLSHLGVNAPDLVHFSHGTTVGINALLQRSGAKTALLCTEGMRDMLEMGRVRRDTGVGLYDPTWKRPQQVAPIVHRRYIREIPERIRFDGSVYLELDEDAARRELTFLRSEGIDAIGICLLNSHVNPVHEQRLLALVAEELPEVYVQSSSFNPVVGEYTRTVGVVVDAYVGGVISSYLGRLQDRLWDRRYLGPALIMQANGGLRTLARTAEFFPSYTLASGPVGGVLGAEYYGRHFITAKNLVCMDIGGTSTDLGLVIDGAAQNVDEWDLEWALTLDVPAIRILSIGAGGGSLIGVDDMGTLHVGPESAGADPGPVAYGRGGTLPTLTDAHVVLGHLRPESFLGGTLELDVKGATAAVEAVADRLGMTGPELALAAVELANSKIEAEVSKMVFEYGVDMRDFVLFSYGGAGALHAAEVARLAGMKEIVVPQVAGEFSTIGMITAPPRVERAAAKVEELHALDIAEVNRLFAELEQETLEDLIAQGVLQEAIRLTRSISGMYTGQSFSNELDLDSWPITAEALDRWRTRFDAMYDTLYGYAAPENPITITTLRVVGMGAGLGIDIPTIDRGESTPPSTALEGHHEVYLRSEGPVRVPFYRRRELLAGNMIQGPGVINDDATTVLVPRDTWAAVDERGNVRIRFTSEGAGV